MNKKSGTLGCDTQIGIKHELLLQLLRIFHIFSFGHSYRIHKMADLATGPIT